MRDDWRRGGGDGSSRRGTSFLYRDGTESDVPGDEGGVSEKVVEGCRGPEKKRREEGELGSKKRIKGNANQPSSSKPSPRSHRSRDSSRGQVVLHCPYE